MVRVCNIGTKVPGDFWVWLSDSKWMPEPRAAQDASAGDEQAAELAALVMQWKAVVVICWQCATGRDGLLCRRWSEWWMSGGKLHCSYISNLKVRAAKKVLLVLDHPSFHRCSCRITQTKKQILQVVQEAWNSIRILAFERNKQIFVNAVLFFCFFLITQRFKKK